MQRVVLSLLTLSLSATIAWASPKHLITHNTTDFESNAFVGGVVPSQYPTKAHSDGKVYWTGVRMACVGHMVDGKCSALIRIGTNTPNPIDLGMLSVQLETGEITPSILRNNGFTMIVNGPGETTILKD